MMRLDIADSNAGGPVGEVSSYRREFFGNHYWAWLGRALRLETSPHGGDGHLIALATSLANETSYCSVAHRGLAIRAHGAELVAAALGEANAASAPPGLPETLRFVRKLTLEPAAIGPEDVERVLAAGITPDQLRAVIERSAAVDVMNRISDALGFPPPAVMTPSDQEVTAGAPGAASPHAGA